MALLKSFIFAVLAAPVAFAIYVPPGQCLSFSTLLTSTQQKQATVCSTAVDYQFFLPTNVTTFDLNQKATAKLNSTGLTILPTACQASILKFICSLVYLQCNHYMVPTNISGVITQVPTYVNLAENPLTTTVPCSGCVVASPPTAACPASCAISPFVKSSPYVHWNTNLFGAGSVMGSPLTPAASIARAMPLPIQRPCGTVCTNVAAACHGITTAMGFSQFQTCSTTRFDYSAGKVNAQNPTKPALTSATYPFQFDPNNNNLYCNAIPAVVTVASSMEVYARPDDGACAGLVQQLYVPPGNLVSPLLAPMQKPGVVQAIIESQLEAQFNQLPVWMTTGCQYALRKYFCGSSMLLGEQQVFAKAFAASGLVLSAAQMAGLTAQGVNVSSLLSSAFYLPSYPAQDVCTQYENECWSFIDVAKKDGLVARCDGVTSTGALMFPTQTQIIKTATILSHSIAFTTNPNTMSTATNTEDYDTNCPQGFVSPTDQTDTDNSFVSGSGCTSACRAPIWTPLEWDIAQQAAVALSALGLCFITVLIVLISHDPKWHSEHLVLCFIGTSATITLWILIVVGGNSTSKVCRNNANGFSWRDGVTTCAVQAVVLNYATLACVLSWFLVCLDMFFRVVLRWGTATEAHKMIHYFIIFFLPLISTLYMISAGVYGYGKSFPWCSYAFTATANVDLWSYYLPITVITLSGLAAVIGVLYKIVATCCKSCCHSRGAAATTPPSDTPKLEAGDDTSHSVKAQRYAEKTAAIYSVWTLVFFVSVFLIIWISIFGFRMNSYRSRHAFKSSLSSWTKCIFKNYDGLSQASWISPCGETIPNRASVNSFGWIIFCSAGQSIFVALIFFPFVNVSAHSQKFGFGLFGTSTEAGNDVVVAMTGEKSGEAAEPVAVVEKSIRDVEEGSDRREIEMTELDDKVADASIAPTIFTPEKAAPSPKKSSPASTPVEKGADAIPDKAVEVTHGNHHEVAMTPAKPNVKISDGDIVVGSADDLIHIAAVPSSILHDAD